jgi:hypothetical protein
MTLDTARKIVRATGCYYRALLRENFLHYISGDIRQPVIAAGVA